MEKTPMQELIDELQNYTSDYYYNNEKYLLNLLEQEKKVIEEAQNDALQTDFYVNYENTQDYYNQKFIQ